MNDIIWKAFKLSDLFEFSSGNTFALKNYNLYNEPGDGLIEVVTSSKDSEKNQFISAGDIPSSCPIYEKSLTINRNGSIGYCLYHDDKFIIPTGDSYTLLHKNEKFKNAMNIYVNSFLSIIITHLFTTTVFGWSYKVNSDRFDRELIILPCLEVGKDDEYIWEENGHYYTLAVNYIKQLMDEAKELREQKTIHLYEAERAKYEAERAKYEAGYEKERTVLVWKGFTLGDLFNFDSSNQLSLNKKALNVSNEASSEFSIALITQSEKNNGVSGYLKETDEIKKKKMKGFLTYSMHFGLYFYHNYDFVLMDTHGSVFRLIPHNTILNLLLSRYECLNYFLGRTITNVCKNGIYNYSWLPNSTRVAREIILLPCLEVGKDDEYIWEENGRYYTLAVEYISYIYLTGKMKNNQKKIDNYTYQY